MKPSEVLRWGLAYLLTFAILNLIEFSLVIIGLIRGEWQDPPKGYWLVWLIVIPAMSLALTPTVVEFIWNRHDAEAEEKP